MLFNLVIAIITILLCFFFSFFRVVCHNFFVISLDIENAKPNLALAITKGAPITLQMMQEKCYQLFQIKQSKIYQNNQKQQYIY